MQKIAKMSYLLKTFQESMTFIITILQISISIWCQSKIQELTSRTCDTGNYWYLAEASLDTYDMHDRCITSIPRYPRRYATYTLARPHTAHSVERICTTHRLRSRTRSAIHTKLAWQQAGGRLRGKVGPLPQLFYPRHIFITKLPYISPRRADLRAHEPMLSPPA
jgi:hypothetical protein